MSDTSIRRLMSAREDQSLPRAFRVRKRRTFLYLQRRGKRAQGQYVVLISKALSEGESKKRHGRLGLTVTKKVGNAAVRNRTKRRLRHIFRTHKTLFADSDVIVLAKPEIVNASFEMLRADVLATREKLKKMSAPRRSRKRKPSKTN